MATNNYTVSAYTDRSPQARAFMSKVAPEDCFQEDISCTNNVHVISAFFDYKYQGPGNMPRPYLKVLGEVTSIFLEEPGAVFPTGTSYIELINKQPVDIDIDLNDEEIASLARKGLFRVGCIKPPENLIDNTMEIPMMVRYIGVYDSPLCTIGIHKRHELTTSTFETGYAALFDVCRENRAIEIAKANGISLEGLAADPTYGNDVQDQSSYVFGNESEDTFENEASEPQVEQQPAPEEEETSVPDKFREIADRNMKKVKTAEGFDARAVVRSIREQADQRKADKIHRAEMLGDPEALEKAMKPISEKEHYQNLSDAVSEGEKQRKDQEQRFVAADAALDGIARANGVEDTTGFGASESSKSESDRQKAENLAHQDDVVKDLEAMNAGNYDIAGAGAGVTEQKKPSREDLLNFLRPGGGDTQKSNDGPELL